MNKFLYITYVDFNNVHSGGVIKKIHGQIKALTKLGYEVHLIAQYGKGTYVEYDGKRQEINLGHHSLGKRFTLLNKVKEMICQEAYFGCYIRFQFFSLDVLEMLKVLERQKIKTVMEIPTYPYESELYQQGIKGIPKLVCDKYFRKSCVRYLHRFVTFFPFESIYGVKTIQTINGLDFSQYPLRKVRSLQKDGDIHMLAIATMFPWHGYDRMIAGMGRFYSHNPQRKVYFHLVGEGKEIPAYRQLTKQYGIQDYVIFHGYQSGEKLEEIVNTCNIAIGSLGAHRIGLHKLSTLKSREYCAQGFPTVNSTPTDILDDKNPTVLYIPEDDSPVSVPDIVTFFERVYFSSAKKANIIASEIREKAEKICSMDATMKPVADFFTHSV